MRDNCDKARVCVQRPHVRRTQRCVCVCVHTHTTIYVRRALQKGCFSRNVGRRRTYLYYLHGRFFARPPSMRFGRITSIRFSPNLRASCARIRPPQRTRITVDLLIFFRRFFSPFSVSPADNTHTHEYRLKYAAYTRVSFTSHRVVATGANRTGAVDRRINVYDSPSEHGYAHGWL